jgi:hypothetical protein
LSRLRGRRAGALESRRRVDHDHANAAVLAPPPAWTTARGTVCTGRSCRSGRYLRNEVAGRTLAPQRHRLAQIAVGADIEQLRVRRDRGHLFACRGWEGGPMQSAQDLEVVDRLVLTRGGDEPAMPALAGRVEVINSRRVIAALPRGEIRLERARAAGARSTIGVHRQCCGNTSAAPAIASSRHHRRLRFAPCRR